MLFHLFASLSLASPSITKPYIKCLDRRVPRATDQCTRLIDNLTLIPWLQSPTTWGEDQTGEGRLPLKYEHSGCTLYLESDSTDLHAKDTFALSSYFPAIYMIDRECAQRGHAGATIVGSRMVTKAYLIKYSNPQSIDSNNITSLNNSSSERRPLLPARSFPKAAIPSVSKPYVRCSVKKIVPSTTECTLLIDNLVAKPWTWSPITWGLHQTGEGRLPFNHEYAGCTFDLLLVGRNPDAEERFILSSYVGLMHMMDRECVGRGYEATAMVGGGHVIKAYMTTETNKSYTGADSFNISSVRRTLTGDAGDSPDSATPDLS